MQPNDPNQIQQNQGGKVMVSAAAFAAKYRSKRECYNFLAVQCEVYLPPYGKCLRLPSNILQPSVVSCGSLDLPAEHWCGLGVIIFW